MYGPNILLWIMSLFNCDFCESQNFLDGPTDNIIPIPTLNPVILGWPFLGIWIFRIITQVLNSFLTQSSQIRPCNAIIYTVIKCKLVNSDPVDSKFVLIQTTYTWSHLILLVALLLFKLSPPFEKRSLFCTVKTTSDWSLHFNFDAWYLC